MTAMQRVYDAIKAGAGVWISVDEIREQTLVQGNIVCNYGNDMCGRKSHNYPGITKKKGEIKKVRTCTGSVHNHEIWFKYLEG